MVHIELVSQLMIQEKVNIKSQKFKIKFFHIKNQKFKIKFFHIRIPKKLILKFEKLIAYLHFFKFK